MISLDSYGTGPHARRVDGPGFTVWFSYRTPIAFQVDGKGLTVRENDWGPTTGRHLNAVDGSNPGDRITGREFTARLATVVGPRFAPDLDGPDIDGQ